jgi:O-6-methylguanine DNA methyltransferase
MIITTMKKKAFEQYRKEAQIKYTYVDISAGILLVLACDKGIFSVTFTDEKKELAGYQWVEKIVIEKLLLVGTEFQQKVWQALLEIPHGKKISYQDLAISLNMPKACRAVANALGANKIAYFIPCHRIIAASGKLGGFKWGVERKAMLLEEELSKVV